MDNIIKKVKTIIDKHKLITVNDKIVVGVSGGPDSMCLLDILLKLKDVYNIEIIVAHINHMIRTQAIQDENYVVGFCKANNIACYVKQYDVLEYAKNYKLSTEEAGRIIRYDFFEEIATTYNANKIAIAHNANDRVETLIINLLRGSGLEGLKSIDYSRFPKIIRPILCLSRNEIEDYCKVNSLNPAIDLTNFENDYTRNKVRNILIPLIKEKFNPNIITTLNNTIEILQSDNNYIEQMVEKEYNNVLVSVTECKIVIDISAFKAQHFSIQSRIIRHILEKLLKTKKGIEYSHINQILSLIDSKVSGKRFSVKDKYQITISFDTVEFTTDTQTLNFCYDLVIPGTTCIKELNLYINTYITDKHDIKPNINLQVFDYDKLEDKRLEIRNRRTGDNISLSGISGTKRLKEFFIDTKTPLSKRDCIPLICDNNDVLWVLGARRTKKYTSDESTKGVLVIEYEYKL